MCKSGIYKTRQNWAGTTTHIASLPRQWKIPEYMHSSHSVGVVRGQNVRKKCVNKLFSLLRFVAQITSKYLNRQAKKQTLIEIVVVYCNNARTLMSPMCSCSALYIPKMLSSLCFNSTVFYMY